MMSTGVWAFLGLTTLASFLACSSDGDDHPPLQSEGGDAGAGVEAGGVGAAGSSDSGELGGSGGDSNEQQAGSGGTAALNDAGGGGQPADAGGGGQPADAGGGGQPADAGGGGQPADAGGGGGGGQPEGGAGGAIAYPTGPYVVCPAIGDEFTVRQGYAHTDEELALAKAFQCDVGGDELGDFKIERFEVQQPTFEVIASPHRFDNYDRFAVVEDCGPRGYLEPVPYTLGLYAEVLEPGVYTRVSCAVDMYLSEQPPPPAPTNVDCVHAKPLPKAPAAALDETRIGDDLPRFYSFTIPSDPDFPDEVHQVTINTGYSIEGAGGADVSLHGVSNDFEGTSSIPWLDGENEAAFADIEPGSYCVELKVNKGVKYSVYYATSAF